MQDNSLTGKQEMFCQEYLVDLNATQSAIRAGYSKRTAGVIGLENLTKPLIREKILQLIEERRNKIKLSQERVIEELVSVAFLDIRELFDHNGSLLNVKDFPENISRALAGIDLIASSDGTVSTKKIRLLDKIRALELLGKHLGMFVEKFDVKHSGAVIQELTQIDSSILIERSKLLVKQLESGVVKSNSKTKTMEKIKSKV